MERDISEILSLTEKTNRYIRRRRDEENNYEGEEIKEKDLATREASARWCTEAREVKTETARGGSGEGVEGREEIG